MPLSDYLLSIYQEIKSKLSQIRNTIYIKQSIFYLQKYILNGTSSVKKPDIQVKYKYKFRNCSEQAESLADEAVRT